MTDPLVGRRPLGRTGLSCTPLTAGCASIGSMPQAYGYGVDEERALATLRAIFAGPFGLVDTARMYGLGESERRIGLVLAEMGGLPAGQIVQTKADWDEVGCRFDGGAVRRSVEGSLQRLGLSSLEIVYLHDPERASFAEVTAPNGALRALLDLRDEGLIRHVGVAGGDLDVLSRYLSLGVFELVITHNRYTLLDRTAEPLIAAAWASGIAVLNAAPFASGLLAKGLESGARYRYLAPDATAVRRYERLREICSRFGVSVAAAALQFSLRDDRLASTIVGLSRPERVPETLALVAEKVPDDFWEEPELTMISRADDIG